MFVDFINEAPLNLRKCDHHMEDISESLLQNILVSLILHKMVFLRMKNGWEMESLFLPGSEAVSAYKRWEQYIRSVGHYLLFQCGAEEIFDFILNCMLRAQVCYFYCK